ncbi:MAG: hypothetical protein DMG39_14035 [Acidobacteria bacterium]|nr:MAG: hypothetical protein DMG39_14035 [Acidobacteriota bacterium]
MQTTRVYFMRVECAGCAEKDGTAEIKQQGCREIDVIQQKNDGVITAGMFKVKGLLIRCNFW